MTTTGKLLKFAREYRVTHQSIYDPISPIVPECPPRTVKVWEPERDLTAGAHICCESEAMRRGREPLTRKTPASN
jgi:hypothetical protein